VDSSIASVTERSAGILEILGPKWRSLRARLRRQRAGAGARVVLLLLLGALFWTAVFGMSYRVLKYFKGVEEIGPLLAGKLLAVGLLSFVAILLAALLGSDAGRLSAGELFTHGAVVWLNNIITFGLLFSVVGAIMSIGVATGPLLAGRTFDVTGSYDLFLLGTIPGCALAGVLIYTLGRYPDHGRAAVHG